MPSLYKSFHSCKWHR